jgi:hypothetical protein
VELLELVVFGWQFLERNCFFGSGAAWSSAKHPNVICTMSKSLICSSLMIFNNQPHYIYPNKNVKFTSTFI